MKSGPQGSFSPPAARILGARAAVSKRTGAGVVVDVVCGIGDRTEREARAQLGPDKYAPAVAEGRTASIDSLLKDIDIHMSR